VKELDERGGQWSVDSCPSSVVVFEMFNEWLHNYP